MALYPERGYDQTTAADALRTRSAGLVRTRARRIVNPAGLVAQIDHQGGHRWRAARCGIGRAGVGGARVTYVRSAPHHRDIRANAGHGRDNGDEYRDDVATRWCWSSGSAWVRVGEGSACEDVFEADREVAHSTLDGVVDGVGDCGLYARRAEHPDAFGSAWDVWVGFLDDGEFGHVGVYGDEVVGESVADYASGGFVGDGLFV